jgi:hypothetical protein
MSNADVARDLRRFPAEVTKALRKELREPVPAVRKNIKARALATLPSGGGLNVWVSKTRITATVKIRGRGAAIRLKGGRNSLGSRSDIRAIDRGRVRHPSWGRRGRGQWHTQTVASAFFTEPVTEARDEWRKAAETAVERAKVVTDLG